MPSDSREMGGGSDAYRAENMASMARSADQAASGQDSYYAAGAGRSAWPVEASGQAGYLPSMFPEPQIVASDLNGPVPSYLYDTDALASGVIQRNVVGSALSAGPSLASAPDLGVVEGMRASGLPFYDGLVAGNNPWEAAAARVGRGLFNAGYDALGTLSGLQTLATNADVRARLIMNGANAIAHPIDTATGFYNAGESYLKNTSLGQMGEDGVRFLAGAAVGGAGGKGFAIAGDLAEGAATANRLAGRASSLEAVTINGATRTTPLGFKGPTEFLNAADDLNAALRSSGITDATVGVRGSSVTGESYRKGTPFGPQSDIDFFVESQQLSEGYRTSKNIPGFVHPGKVLPDYPLLGDWATKWTNQLGREVTPGVFVPGTLPNQPAIRLK